MTEQSKLSTSFFYSLLRSTLFWNINCSHTLFCIILQAFMVCKFEVLLSFWSSIIFAKLACDDVLMWEGIRHWSLSERNKEYYTVLILWDGGSSFIFYLLGIADIVILVKYSNGWLARESIHFIFFNGGSILLEANNKYWQHYGTFSWGKSAAREEGLLKNREYKYHFAFLFCLIFMFLLVDQSSVYSKY